jgi:glycosyltransferase involved in cell wall biosynthesis
MKDVTVFVGGSVGSDPWSAKTWSGTSQQLLKAMEQGGLLDKAVGLKLSRLTNGLLLAKNFNRNRAAWRKQYYLDPAYRRALTGVAGQVRVESPVCMQYGSMFCLPDVFGDKRCVSYQDGNLAQSSTSGFGMQGVSPKRVEQALRYEEETSQKMAAVLTFSEYLRQSFIRDYRVPAERVFNVGGAVNLTEVPAPPANKDYAANRILFIGVEFKRKGGAVLLEAFKRVREAIPNVELNIVGPSVMEAVPEGVVFHGRLSKGDPAQKAELERLFRECTLFVLPSLYEPFGIAPLEAMLYQMPCLLTDAWAFPEFVTPGVNGELAEKGSAEDFAGKMVGLLSDPARLAAMGASARERVLARYTWDAVVGRMTEVVRGL